MPVSHAHKIIFVHIPKTAGSSMEYALNMHGKIDFVGKKKYFPQEKNFNTLFGDGLQHLSSKKILKILGSNVYHSYLKVSVIRNPFDRLVSYVAWLNGKWNEEAILTSDEFSEYIQNCGKRFKLGVNLPMPQYKYLLIGNKLAIDIVLRYENLLSDVEYLQNQVGSDIKLEIRMKSYHLDYLKYYTNPELIDMIKNYYYKDFVYFGYDIDEI